METAFSFHLRDDGPEHAYLVVAPDDNGGVAIAAPDRLDRPIADIGAGIWTQLSGQLAHCLNERMAAQGLPTGGFDESEPTLVGRSFGEPLVLLGWALEGAAPALATELAEGWCQSSFPALTRLARDIFPVGSLELRCAIARAALLEPARDDDDPALLTFANHLTSAVQVLCKELHGFEHRGRLVAPEWEQISFRGRHGQISFAFMHLLGFEWEEYETLVLSKQPFRLPDLGLLRMPIETTVRILELFQYIVTEKPPESFSNHEILETRELFANWLERVQGGPE